MIKQNKLKTIELVTVGIILSRISYANFCKSLDTKCLPEIKSDILLCKTSYAVEYNCKTKQADYGVYYVKPDAISTIVQRDDNFKDDYTLPDSCQSHLNDYKKSGYDRGHLVPYASMDDTKQSVDESFLLSNMSPQKPSKTIGDKIAVADYFFKIIYSPKKSKTLAFVIPNKTVSRKDVAKYRTSIANIEQRTVIKFLEFSSKSEKAKVNKMWGLYYGGKR